MKLTNKEAPHRFTLNMEGKGAPGFVKGSALMELKEQEGKTDIVSTAIQVGGLIAAVGSRAIEAVGKKLAQEFFQKFATLIGAGASSAQ